MSPSACYRYHAEVLRVVDGDTLRVRVDLGFSVLHVVTVRLAGLDCPELRTPEGVAAAAFTKAWAGTLVVGVVVVETTKPDKYGRALATVWNPASTVSLNEALLAAGHARPYHGERRS